MPQDDISAFYSLGADINKTNQKDSPENAIGVVSDKLPELKLNMTNEKIVNLANKWEKTWNESEVKSVFDKQYKENENYWVGKHFMGLKDSDRAMVDNIIFESLETFLPQATRRNPEPLVALDSREESDDAKERYKERVKKRLADLADLDKLRLKLKTVGRYWAIFQLGVGKLGWDIDNDIPTLTVIRTSKLILDPKAAVNENGYTGQYIGEYRKMEASILLTIMEGDESTATARAFIKELIDKKEGTIIQFTEWWTPQYMFWKLKDKILLKKKNPHWNYDREEEDAKVDDYGEEYSDTKEVEGINHFPVPKMPYEFLAVFGMGDQPIDKTGLIQQNLSNQDQINKRNKQIDRNVDSMNGGFIVSGERSGLTKEQSSSVAKAILNGGTAFIPSGSARDAIEKLTSPGLPADVYNDVLDKRARVRDIFGVKGSSQAGLSGESTVRGKIMGRSLDTDRIGGGVTEYLEQFADGVYNWYLQLLYVYGNDFQFIEGANPPKIVLSVKEGSLLPKDSVTNANQAIELASAGKMSTPDLYKRLEYPNPDELAANAWLEVNAPQLLYRDNPLVQEALGIQAAQAAQTGLAPEAPPETINQPTLGVQDGGSGELLSQVPEGQIPG